MACGVKGRDERDRCRRKTCCRMRARADPGGEWRHRYEPPRQLTEPEIHLSLPGISGARQQAPCLEAEDGLVRPGLFCAPPPQVAWSAPSRTAVVGAHRNRERQQPRCSGACGHPNPRHMASAAIPRCHGSQGHRRRSPFCPPRANDRSVPVAGCRRGTADQEPRHQQCATTTAPREPETFGCLTSR